jgi:hypothetical protein
MPAAVVFEYTVSFLAAPGDLPSLELDASSRIDAAAATVSIVACDIGRVVALRTRVASDSTAPLSGALVLTLGDAATPPLPANVSAASLAAALNALPGVAVASVSRSALSVPLNTWQWVITILRAVAAATAPPLRVDARYITGGVDARACASPFCPLSPLGDA